MSKMKDHLLRQEEKLARAAPDLLAALQPLVDYESLPHGQFKLRYGCNFAGADKADAAAGAKHQQHLEQARDAIQKARATE